MISKIKNYYIKKQIKELKELRDELEVRSVLAVLLLKPKEEIRIYRDAVRDINIGIRKREDKIK